MRVPYNIGGLKRYPNLENYPNALYRHRLRAQVLGLRKGALITYTILGAP